MRSRCVRNPQVKAGGQECKDSSAQKGKSGGTMVLNPYASGRESWKDQSGIN